MANSSISFEVPAISKEIASDILKKYQNVTYSWVNTDGTFLHASVDLLDGSYGITLEKEGSDDLIAEVKNLSEAIDVFLEVIREARAGS